MRLALIQSDPPPLDQWLVLKSGQQYNNGKKEIPPPKEVTYFQEEMHDNGTAGRWKIYDGWKRGGGVLYHLLRQYPAPMSYLSPLV